MGLWFVDFFFDIFNILMAAIFSMVGVAIGIIFYKYIIPSKNQILYCRERDGRGEEYHITNEDALSLETNTDPPLRFYKFGRSYDFLGRMGRVFRRFLAKEGTGFTWRLQGFDKKSKPIDLKFPTLEEAIKFRWGDLYDVVPEGHKELLRQDKILVTVNLEQGITPKGYDPITEQTIVKKGNEDMLRLLANAFKGVLKPALSQWIFIFGSGIGAGWVACTLLLGS